MDQQQSESRRGSPPARGTSKQELERRYKPGVRRSSAGSNSQIDIHSQIGYPEEDGHLQPKVTAQQTMAHYFGFGNLALDKLGGTPQSKVTGHAPSGKFKEKLILKQRQLEENMMENRLRKLMKEEDRLKKQTQQADQHSAFADKVQERRQSDLQKKHMYAELVEESRQRSNYIFQKRKKETVMNINQHQDFLQSGVNALRVEKKGKQVIIEETIKGMKEEELNFKQQQAANGYRIRQEQGVNQKFAREHLHESIQRVHNQQAVAHTKEQQKHESRLKHLEEMEARLISNLQGTMAMKNQAVDKLNMKSPGLKKAMAPRLAYRYKNPRSGSSGSVERPYNTSQGGGAGFEKNASQMQLREHYSKSEVKTQPNE